MALARLCTRFLRPFPVRSFAKKRRAEEENEGQELPEFNIDDTKTEMLRSISWLEGQLNNLKVGRSDPRIYEEVIVPSTHVSLKTLGQAIPRSVSEVMFKVFDATNADKVIDALKASNLQITCRKESTGNVIITVPKASAEHKAKLVKQAKQLAEDARNTVRRQRQTTLQVLKGYKHMSKDETKRIQKEVQTLTDAHIERILKIVQEKETQLEEN